MKYIKCSVCKGTRVKINENGISVPCPNCKGAGFIPEKKNAVTIQEKFGLKDSAEILIEDSDNEK